VIKILWNSNSYIESFDFGIKYKFDLSIINICEFLILCFSLLLEQNIVKDECNHKFENRYL